MHKHNTLIYPSSKSALRSVLRSEAFPVPTLTTLSDIADEHELTENPDVPLRVQDYDNSIWKEYLIYRKDLHNVNSLIW